MSWIGLSQSLKFDRTSLHRRVQTEILISSPTATFRMSRDTMSIDIYQSHPAAGLYIDLNMTLGFRQFTLTTYLCKQFLEALSQLIAKALVQLPLKVIYLNLIVSQSRVRLDLQGKDYLGSFLSFYPCFSPILHWTGTIAEAHYRYGPSKGKMELRFQDSPIHVVYKVPRSPNSLLLARVTNTLVHTIRNRTAPRW